MAAAAPTSFLTAAVRRIPPIQCLLTFEALARLRSVTQTAEELCVTPSAVSHRVKQLEQILGVRLFGRADFSLTTEGSAYLAHVREGLGALQRFFAAQRDAGLDLGMTFDMGNWHWLGECPLEAARTFAPHVRYVHCKGVQRRPDKWVAVPLAESAAPWRAVLRALPADVPHAIEYPLVGNDLVAVTRAELNAIRAARSLA